MTATYLHAELGPAAVGTACSGVECDCMTAGKDVSGTIAQTVVVGGQSVSGSVNPGAEEG